MDLNKKTMRKLALLITFGLVLYWALTHTAQAGQMLSSLLTLFLPFVLGGCIAFLINVLLRPVERGWEKLWGKRYGPGARKAKRPVCLLASTLLMLGAIFALFFIVAPAFRDSVVNFVSMLPARLVQVGTWWNELILLLKDFGVQLPEFSLNGVEIQKKIVDFVTQYGQSFLNTTIDTTIGITSSIFSVMVTFFLAFFFSLYVLAQKEALGSQATRIIRAFCSEKRADWLLEVGRLTNKTFSNFVTGQLTEAVILGSLCFVGMTIFRFPYAGVIGVLVGFTALIPIFGAFIGVGVGAFLILLISPIKAFWFVVFVIILQQIEGNLIYPRVVGKSVGLPGIWVLAAVTIGGNAFGLAGMLVAVPTCSVLYTLLRQLVHARLEKKGLAAPAPKEEPRQAP